LISDLSGIIFFLETLQERRYIAMAMENVARRETIREEKRAMEFVAGGSLAQSIAGTGAIALSIIGLAGIFTPFMAAIAAILVGIALLFRGGAVGARFSTLMHDSAGGRLGAVELGSGMTAEFLGGAAGIVLGILSLMGVFPAILVPVAAIVFGGALVLGIGVTMRLNDLEIEKACDSQESRHVARAAVKSATGVQVLIGLGSVVLGILAIIGTVPMILALVAMLSVGFSNMLSGSALTGRMLSAFHCA
jgi:hypothetical protein